MSNVILGANGIAIRQGIYQESSVALTDLGRFIDFEDGRKFRYCKASGAITKGHMAAAGAVVANDNTVTQTGMTVTISNGYVGETVIKVLLGAATTLNLYEDGLFVVEGGTGLGQCHRIKSNKAGGASVAVPCELTLYDPLVVALDATSIISLTKNKYKDVVVAPVTVVREPIGVPLITITTLYYFWAQTRGHCAIVVDTGDTILTGDYVMNGSTVPGAVEPVTATDVTVVPFGIAVQIAAADTYATIDLHLE